MRITPAVNFGLFQYPVVTNRQEIIGNLAVNILLGSCGFLLFAKPIGVAILIGACLKQVYDIATAVDQAANQSPKTANGKSIPLRIRVHSQRLEKPTRLDWGRIATNAEKSPLA